MIPCQYDMDMRAPCLQILGVPRDADSHRIETAYRKKKMLAEKNGDSEALKQIEDAHNSIFMASLNMRLSVRCLAFHLSHLHIPAATTDSIRVYLCSRLPVDSVSRCSLGTQTRISHFSYCTCCQQASVWNDSISDCMVIWACHDFNYMLWTAKGSGA
jgi:hypothetical protein